MMFVSSARLLLSTSRNLIPAATITLAAGTTTTTSSALVATTSASERASMQRTIRATNKLAGRLLSSLQQQRRQQLDRTFTSVPALTRRNAPSILGKKTSSFSTASVSEAGAGKGAPKSSPPAGDVAKAPMTEAPTSPAGGFSFVQWYEGHLQTRPVVTKMITGSLLWGVGDAVAQVVPQVSSSSAPSEEKSSSSSSSSTSIAYDWPRTGRAAFFGFALHAPCSHVHYNFLEWLTIRCGITGLKIPLFKAFMEQFVYWSWFSNALYHGAMGAMLGMNASQIYDRIADVLWETQKAQWVFWIPVQLLNFQYVPVRHQLNVVLVTSIAWTALLSAWYPPQDQDDKKDGRKDDAETRK